MMDQREHLCECGCGQPTKLITASDPRWGRVKGQYSRFVIGHGGNFKHRHSRARQSPTYRSWSNMIQRCTNPNNTAYSNYGERGIEIDPRWLNFECFLADMGEQPDGLTIERRDNDKGYCKENCCWATYKQQNNNRRSKYRNKTHCAKGHPLWGDNLFTRPSGGKKDGGRGCRVCQRERVRVSKARQFCCKGVGV